MDYLIDFANREDVRAVARSFLKHHEAVQGITVDLDDFWLASWQLYTSLMPNDFRRIEDSLLEAWVYGPPWLRAGAPDLGWRMTVAEPFVTYPYGIDTSWTPPSWERYTAWRGLRPEPYALTVILRPEVPRQSQFGLAEVDPDGFQIRLEPRPTARLYAKSTDAIRPIVGGVSVSSPRGDAGTLGGILEDRAGQRFGLTCAHVLADGDEVQQPSPRDNSGSAARVGTCIACSTLNIHTPPLDPYDASINQIDAAVVELDQLADLTVLAVGPLAAVAPKSQVHPNSSVEVVGKASGHRLLYIGGVTMVHEFDFKGAKFGYKNLFELKTRSRFHGITGTFRKPVKPGDSGAWVFKAGTTGMDWLGVVVAGDGPVGYAAPAEFVTDWLESNVGIESLSVS